MKDRFILAPGRPHELLGLLRRMPGIEEISMLLDSEKLLQTFRKYYPDNKICVEIMDEACRLNIISEMAGIINDPMWRKRSFINKSAIRIMSAGKLKEYQMCELLETMMQLLDWNFEIQIMRRWKTSLEDSVDYNREHPRVAEGRKGMESAADEDSADNNRNIYDDTDEPDTYEADTYDSDEDDPDSYEAYEFSHKHAGSRTVRKNVMNESSQNKQTYNSDNRHRRQPEDDGMADSKRSRSSRLGASKRRKNIVTVKYSYLDNDGMVTDIKGYIQNEIIKSGIRFESIMNNAVKRDVRSAIRGNADAQYRMGSYYAEPDTKHTDYEEALKWYRVSASQGNKKAQFEIGMLYDGGKIKCPDYKKEAIKCYLALAEAGFPTAQCKLGMKYRLGDGVDEDINEAIKWFKRAATQGHTDAQRNLGDIYMAINKHNEAMKWYERAAAAGDYYSTKLLGKRKRS